MNNDYDNYQYEKEQYQLGKEYIAGVDEVGRGPLAGPVVACRFQSGSAVPKDQCWSRRQKVRPARIPPYIVPVLWQCGWYLPCGEQDQEWNGSFQLSGSDTAYPPASCKRRKHPAEQHCFPQCIL